MSDSSQDGITQTNSGKTDISPSPALVLKGQIWARLVTCRNYINTVELSTDVLTLGKLRECDVNLLETEMPKNKLSNMSKQHFTIRRHASSTADLYFATIEDHSKNGTYINGRLIGKNNKNILSHNDKISIGFQSLTVYCFQLTHVTEDLFLSKSLQNKYMCLQRLGEGACGTVTRVVDKFTMKEYAIKKINKGNESKIFNMNHPSRIWNEINILLSVSHPCIVNIQEFHERNEHVFIVLEYMKGGDLSDRILSINAFPESVVKFLFYQIAMAVEYLHDRNIVHRDIKAQNILLDSDSTRTVAKLSDFGLSKVFDNSALRTVCGTLFYQAPELFDNKRTMYDSRIDVWSLGVLLYYMLARDLPFRSSNAVVLKKMILNGDYDMFGENWRNVSSDAKDLISKMLTVNVNKRIDISDVLCHPWIKTDVQMKADVLKMLDSNGSQSDADEHVPKKRKMFDCD